MSVPDWMIDTPSPSADDLATLVARLAHALRKAAPDNDLADKATDYLLRHGLSPSPLRAAPAHPAEGVPACPKPQNPHYDYLKKYWQDGFDGMELVACMGDKPLKAWHDGKSARSAYDAAQGTGVPAPAVDALDAKDRECLAIGRAVNRAALELPADGDIRIEIENGAGVVYVYEPKYGDWRYIDSGEVFSAQINEAIDSAIAAQAKGGDGA